MPGINKGPYAGLVLEGVVTAFFPVGHPRNRSGIEDEYSVEITSSLNQLPLPNCRLAQAVGYRNGFEAQLRPASKSVTGAARNPSRVRGTMTDGDVVLVQFVDGLVDRPIITHVISSAHSQWRTKIDAFKGPAVRRRQAGTDVLLDFDGNIVIDLSTDDEGITAADKSFLLSADGTPIVMAKQSEVKFFGGAKKVARKDDAVSVTLPTITLPVVVPPSGGTMTVTVPAMTLTGKIDDGSSKLFTD